jgi:hypothetical protein
VPDRVETFDVTCAASVAAADAVEVPFVYDPGIPRRVTIIIPDGHAGLTGIALGYGHQAIIPRTVGRFISSNDEHVAFDLTNYPGGPIWSAFVCNNDTQAHVWEIILELDEIPESTPADIVAPLPVSSIVDAGTLALQGP